MTNWHAIPGASGYEITSDGKRVRSLDRRVPLSDGRLQFVRGKELSPQQTPAGYWTVSIRFDDWPRRRVFGVHRLICMVFHGPRPTTKHEVRHLNGNPTDNRPENLAWGTKSENAFDAVMHGVNRNARKVSCPQGHPYDSQDSRRRYCSVCRRTYSREYKRRNREKESEQASRRYRSDLENSRRRNREYYAENSDSINEYARRYYAENAERIQERRREAKPRQIDADLEESA